MLRTRSPRKETISNCCLHSNSLSNKTDNSLLAVRDINHKYIVVGSKNDKELKVIEQPALCVAEGKVGYGKKKSDCGRGGTSDLMMRY